MVMSFYLIVLCCNCGKLGFRSQLSEFIGQLVGQASKLIRVGVGFGDLK